MDKAVKTLFFEEWQYINSAMDRHYFHLFCAAYEAVDFTESVAIWGPGWPGWNNSVSVAANIERRWPKMKFDLIVTRHLPASIGIASAVYLTYRHECVYNEMSYDDERRWYCTWSEGPGGNFRYPWKYFNIVLLTYKSDLEDLKKKFDQQNKLEDIQRTLFHEWSHAVLPGSILNYWNEEQNYSNRPFDICLIGCTDEYLYPIRKKLSEWISKGHFEKLGLKAKTLRHFGYTDMMTAKERENLNITAENLEKQYIHYISFIRSCKAVFVTHSRRNLDLRKYTEIATAGSLMIGNTPKETRFWDPFVVDISEFLLRGNVDAIVRTVREWLSPAFSRRREEMMYTAQQRVLQYRTYQKKWKDITDIFRLYEGGSRGFQFNNKIS
jgi:hypothetical protein